MSTFLCYSEEGVDDEVVYKMANVMSECGGLEAILKRFAFPLQRKFF